MLPFYLIGLVPPLKKKLYRMYTDRANQLTPKMFPFITSKDTILDIGSGTGVISKTIQIKKGITPTLVDVQFNSMCDLYPVVIYDGKTLPFAENTFKKSLLITVLHHCADSSRVLDEAARVTEKQIIVVEDLFDDLLSRVITFVGDCLVNWEIHSPFTNNSKQNWIKIFEDKNFKVVHTSELKLKCIGFPFKLGIFVLEKKKDK